MAPPAQLRAINECRQCATYCDRVIAPASCIAANCPALYVYDDPLSGNRYLGCMEKVFGVEIDLTLFRKAERSRAGFGAVKVTGRPQARCAFTVERAYDGGETAAFRCRNRRFADLPDDAHGAVRAFDLREGLEAA